MNLPRFLSGLFALVASASVAAFQVGQLEATSRLGEPLVARIVLHGAGTDDFENLETEVLPEIGLAATHPAHRVVASMVTGYARDTFGQAYVTLRTAQAIDEPALSFRLRIRHDGRGTIAHFTLALAPPAGPAARTRPRIAPPRAARPTPPVAAPQAAGAGVATGTRYPVRPGDSLWRILRAQGLSTDATIIARIVQDNPHAFTAGDASRLRVGVELILPADPARTPAAATQPMPQASSAARATDAPLPGVKPAADPRAVTRSDERVAARAAGDASQASNAAPGGPAPAVPTRPAPAAAADTAARLQALSARFAAIRARYAEQSAAAPRARIAPVTPRAIAGPPTTAITPPAAAATAPPRAHTAVLLIGAGLLLLIALGAGVAVALRRRQRHRLHQRARHADLERVAEISRKTEKRLLLEDTVRRNLRANGAGAPSEDDQGALLREVDHRIAHGQYAAARALLENVIAAKPGNYRAKLRLAEIHYLDENARAFAALADELLREHRADIGDEGWQRVLRMGRVLTPDRPPFSGPVAISHRA